MSTTSLSLTKAKEYAIDFIKKYKDSLRECESRQTIDNDDIKRYEAMTPYEFFNTGIVQANFGLFFNLFDISMSKNGNKPTIWMGEHKNINDLTKKIDKKSKSDNELLYFWQMEGTWYNFTTARLDALAKIFDQLGAKPKPKAVAKKSSKKQAKKVVKKQNTIEISDAVTIEQDIAFIDTDNDKFDHLMNIGGKNVNINIDNTNDLNASNQIDHVINAFKLAKKELDVFISELVKAKEHGAKNVVDSFWCPIKEFKFH